MAPDGIGNEQAALRLHPMQRCQNAPRGNALPCDPAVRESLFDVIAIMTGEVPGYDLLSRTPFNDYPERGRRELEALWCADRCSQVSCAADNRVLSPVAIGRRSPREFLARLYRVAIVPRQLVHSRSAQ